MPELSRPFLADTDIMIDQDARNAGWSDPSSTENSTGIISFVATLRRPKLAVDLRSQIARRAAKGETAYAIAKALRIDRHTAAKYLGEC